MAGEEIRLIIDGAEVAALLRSEQGPVALDLFRRADRVIAGARDLIDHRRSIWTQGKETGRLADSIVKRHFMGPSGLGVSIVAGAGLNPSYALWVHEGNGEEGGYIYPKVKPRLVFEGPDGTLIFAKRVKVSKPNPFLRDALPLQDG